MTLQTEITGAAALEQTAESTDGTIVNSPFCREIRSKKYYFLQEMPTETIIFAMPATIAGACARCRSLGRTVTGAAGRLHDRPLLLPFSFPRRSLIRCETE